MSPLTKITHIMLDNRAAPAIGRQGPGGERGSRGCEAGRPEQAERRFCSIEQIGLVAAALWPWQPLVHYAHLVDVLRMAEAVRAGHVAGS